MDLNRKTAYEILLDVEKTMHTQTLPSIILLRRMNRTKRHL